MVEVKSAPGSSHKRKSAVAKVARKVAAEAASSSVSVSSRPVRQVDGVAEDVSAPRGPRVSKVTAAASPVAVVAAPAPRAEVVVGSPVVGQASGVVAGAAVGSSLSGGVPGSPLVNSPVLWVVAAVSRREFAGGGNASARTASVVSSGEPATASAMAMVSAAPSNTAPVITTLTVDTPNAVSGVATGQFAASDAEGNKLKVVASAVNGKVVINAKTGVLAYTPSAAARHGATAMVNPVLSDTVTVVVTDGKGGSASRSVSVPIVALPNTPPTAPVTVGKPDRSTGVVTVTVKGADKDKDTLTYAVTTGPAKGSVVMTKPGTFVYTPTVAAQLSATAATTDMFKVTVTDGHGGSVVAEALVSVAPNKAPVNGVAPTLKTNPVSGVVTGTVRATDADNNPLTYTVAGSTSKGVVTINAKSGAFVYTPSQAARQAAAEGVAGALSDSFTVTITDSQRASITQTVTVGVVPNKAPVNATSSVTSTNTTTGVVSGTVAASDPELEALRFTAAASVAGGKVTINAKTGSFTYTPTAAARHAASVVVNPVTTDTFTVTITDLRGASLLKTVTVTVVPANTKPTATVTVGKPNIIDGTVTGTVKGTDKDKDTLTYSAPAGTTKGVIAINASTGAFIYTPTAAARNAAATPGAPTTATPSPSPSPSLTLTAVPRPYRSP